jgi:hypothetical protein
MANQYDIDDPEPVLEYWIKVIVCKLFHRKYWWNEFDGWSMNYGCDKCKRKWY